LIRTTRSEEGGKSWASHGQKTKDRLHREEGQKKSLYQKPRKGNSKKGADTDPTLGGEIVALQQLEQRKVGGER